MGAVALLQRPALHLTPLHTLCRAAIEEGEGKEGRFDGALRQADQACLAAHTARYGGVSRAMYKRLMAAGDAAEDAAGGSDDEEE